MREFYHSVNESMLNFAAFVATRKAHTKAIMSNQKGHEWIDQGLSLVIITLPLAVAAIAVVAVVVLKYTGLTDQIVKIPIPTL